MRNCKINIYMNHFDNHIIPNLKALKDISNHYAHWLGHTCIYEETSEMSILEYQKWFRYNYRT